MKIAVYGGTGMIGSRVVGEAARRGHDVTALSRRPGAAPPPGVTVEAGDAADVDAVRAVAARHDVVIAALAPSREPDSDVNAFSEIIAGVAAAVGERRLIVVGGAGSLLVAPGVRRVDTPDFPAAYRQESLATALGLDALRAAGPEVDWTYLCPAPLIKPGERTGEYRIGRDEAVGDVISAEDYAVALLDEVERPAHRRMRFTVAN